MINDGHITPCWDLDNIKSLNFKLDYHKDPNIVKQYVDAGHSQDHIKLWNYFEPNPMPVDVSIFCGLFPELNHISVAINKFTPGQYLPLHRDLYSRYSQVYDVSDISQIKRIVVMIEDGYPGQISQIDKTVWTDWKAGNWISWVGEESHAVYNFSMHDRYAWQITGVIK